MPKNRNLAGVASSMQVAPEQVAGFRHTQASGVEQPKQNAIAWFCFGGEDPLNVLLREDPFRQAILVAGQRQFRGRIESQVPYPDAETEQALDGGQRAHAGDRNQWTKRCRSARVMRERGFFA